MVESTNIPRHIAIIMDGNGRWAQERGKERLYGHIQGVESVRGAIMSARRHGVRYLMLYVFSTENWGRPQQEVDGLMELFCECVINETDDLVAKGVRIEIIGDRSTIPPKVSEHFKIIESKTASGDKLTVVLALNYGAREEITRAAKNIAAAVAKGEMSPDDITPELLNGNLYTAGYPEPDLLIRTGGEYRLSNFLLWQSAYSELYFTDTYWPDFGEKAFDEAMEAYAGRERRYGLITKQIL